LLVPQSVCSEYHVTRWKKVNPTNTEKIYCKSSAKFTFLLWQNTD